MNERRYFAELDDDSTTSSELYATLDGLPATTSESSLTERLATMSATRATTATVGVLVVALWAAGHLGADTMMIAVAVAILLVIWRRPHRGPTTVKARRHSTRSPRWHPIQGRGTGAPDRGRPLACARRERIGLGVTRRTTGVPEPSR